MNVDSKFVLSHEFNKKEHEEIGIQSVWDLLLLKEIQLNGINTLTITLSCLDNSYCL